VLKSKHTLTANLMCSEGHRDCPEVSQQHSFTPTHRQGWEGRKVQAVKFLWHDAEGRHYMEPSIRPLMWNQAARKLALRTDTYIVLLLCWTWDLIKPAGQQTWACQRLPLSIAWGDWIVFALTLTKVSRDVFLLGLHFWKQLKSMQFI